MNKRTGLMIGIVALLVVCCCCVAGIAVVALDPFQWNLVDNFQALLGGGDPVAAAMPADSELYLGVNLANARPDQLKRVVQPFLDVMEDEDVQDMDSLLEEMDTQLQEDLGLTFTEDVQPWVGASAGISLSELKLDEYGGLESARLVIAVQSRDNKKADAFLQKLFDAMKKQSPDAEFAETEYNKVKIYAMTPEYGDGLAFARSGGLVLISLKAEDIQQVVDTPKGDSLAQSETYKKLLKALPKNRLLTLTFDTAQLKDLYQSLYSDLPADEFEVFGGSAANAQEMLMEQLEKVSGQAMSLSIVDVGLAMDVVALYNTDKLTEQDKKSIQAVNGDYKMIDRLPEQTLMYVGGWLLEDGWPALRDQIIQASGISQAEFDEAMQAFEEQVGFNPDTDLLPYLGGEMAVAIFPSQEGLLASQMQVELGALAVMGTTNADPVFLALEKLSQAATEMGGLTVKEETTDDLNYFVITDPMSEAEAVAYGMGQRYLLLGTSGSALEELFGSGPSLAKSPRYQSATKALPAGMNPVFYLDIEGMLQALETGLLAQAGGEFEESAKFLQPVPRVIAGAKTSGGDTVTANLIIFIKPPK
jgi:hypothetical protein